ncbi:MAG: GGDEF domain-containing protein, partial [Pseudobdellovibrionaceae bacterium]
GVRVGGEEFALILPSTNAQDAKNLAEFLRTHIEKMSVPLEDGKSFSVTISCGIAEFDWSERSADLLYKTTDEALYKAKMSGRNQSCVAMQTKVAGTGT